MSDGLQDVIILDLETARLFGWCQRCGQPAEAHYVGTQVCKVLEWLPPGEQPTYDPIPDNWKGRMALGLALGGIYSYRHNTYMLFDTQTVVPTMQQILAERPYLVTFNGIRFDALVMIGVAWDRMTARWPREALSEAVVNRALAVTDPFRNFCSASYDLFEAIRQSDPARQYAKGIHSLAALCQANHLGDKFGESKEVPAAWQRGEVALVANHCLADVRLTKRLFELAMRQGFLERLDNTRVLLPRPADLPAWWHSDIRRED